MAAFTQAPPVLSTPDSRIFEEPTPVIVNRLGNERLPNDELRERYEVERTAKEICEHEWGRIALQFPDEMLRDGPRVFESLRQELYKLDNDIRAVQEAVSDMITDTAKANTLDEGLNKPSRLERKLYILADTSYGACCVDEIAAEHVSADVVVHYGRACLSPTSRLPVIHVFTSQPLDTIEVVQAFKNTFPGHAEKVILMADVTYSSHMSAIYEAVIQEGYTAVFSTSIVHNPSSPLPNRTLPQEVAGDETSLEDYHLFHISEPPASLLLTISSRVKSIHIFPTHNTTVASRTLEVSTAMTLRRRYALLTSLSTASIFGILINTLSVKNYLHIVDHVKAQIAAAGKKSYTFVVGKVNAAKVANFSEVGGWVVIGCWESSLIESKDFWKPIITPFELGLALQDDRSRVWTGEWKSDFNDILRTEGENQEHALAVDAASNLEETPHDIASLEIDSETESAPPEFDLRTGRYVSHSRPMRLNAPVPTASTGSKEPNSTALINRTNGDLTTIGGEVSPAAEYLRSKRTWKGLGSDFEIAYEDGVDGQRAGAQIEEGRAGVAKGYTAGHSSAKS
ncbi:MAG: Diphthamide biosynthesis protein 2 [Vezdaea acicularis]|nr:MAG: Diphthamide biosynthesis protein 2 [Vezdaea acicularis]